MENKAKFNTAVKIGAGIVAISFLISFLLTPILTMSVGKYYGAVEGVKWGTACYISSWIVMGIGIVIGGKGAKEIVLNWIVKFKKGGRKNSH